MILPELTFTFRKSKQLWEGRAFLPTLSGKGILPKAKKTNLCIQKKRKRKKRKQICEQVEPDHGAIGIKYLTVMETKKGSLKGQKSKAMMSKTPLLLVFFFTLWPKSQCFSSFSNFVFFFLFWFKCWIKIIKWEMSIGLGAFIILKNKNNENEMTR